MHEPEDYLAKAKHAEEAAVTAHSWRRDWGEKLATGSKQDVAPFHESFLRRRY